MSQRVLVTGGSGFLGSHLVRELLAAGHEVCVLCRKAGPALEQLGATVFRGSILDKVALQAASKQCDAIFHLAGRVSRDPRDEQALRDLHVQGTINVIEAASEAGIKRVIYVSTSGTIAVSRDASQIATEDGGYPTELTSRWPYYATKIEAEQAALQLAEQQGVDLICLNPSLLLGPGDSRMSSTGDVLRVLERKIPALPSGGLNFVDVRDVATAAVAGLQHGRPGERYLLGAENWTVASFLTRISKLSHVPISSLPAPDGLTRLAARLTEPVFRKLNRQPPLDVVSVEMSQLFWYFDSEKAKQELNFSPRPADETLLDTIHDLNSRLELQ